MHEDNLNTYHLIVSKYKPLIKRYAKKYSYLHQGCIDDSQQEILLGIWESVCKRSTDKWTLSGIMTFGIFNGGYSQRLRDAHKKLAKEVETEPEDIPEYQEEEWMNNILLHDFISSLSQKKQRVITLKIHGYNVKEIAEKLNIAQSDVYFQLAGIKRRWLLYSR